MKITILSDIQNLGKNEVLTPGDQVNYKDYNAQPYLDYGMAVEGWIDITESAARMAKKEGVDITEITGSGADGRIVKSDIEAVVGPGEKEADTEEAEEPDEAEPERATFAADEEE